MRRILATAFVGALVLVGAACDDDDNGGGGASADEWCELNEELSGIGENPSDEQLNELADQAPADIRDDVQPVVEFFIEEGAGASLPDDLQERSDNVSDWIQENCADDDNGDE